MMPLDLDQLRSFILIADTGSFTKTAEAVHKTQSAVSMQVRRLEERVGKPLFTRDGRHNRLTDDGKKLLTYARQLIDLNNETIAAFKNQHIHGHIRLGLPDLYGSHLLADILPKFTKSHPFIEVTVICETSHQLIDRIRRGSLDLALITQTADKIRSVKLCTRQLFWVGSAIHDTHLKPVIPLALGSHLSINRKAALETLEAMEKKFRIVLTCDSIRIIQSAVINGVAIACLPEEAITEGMRILNCMNGYNNLPELALTTIRGQVPQNAPLDLLQDYLQESLINSFTNAN